MSAQGRSSPGASLQHLDIRRRRHLADLSNLGRGAAIRADALTLRITPVDFQIFIGGGGLISVLQTVFTSAAAPQKCLFIALALAMPAALLLAVMARSGQGPWRRVLGELRLAGPLLGIMMGGMNSFHMARTILKLPYLLTAKQIAPGILEVSTFVVMGVLVGIVAQVCSVAADAATAQQR